MEGTGVVAPELRSSVIVCVAVSTVVVLLLFGFFWGREGGKYIAFVFESTSPLPICMRRPNRLKRSKIRLEPLTRSSLVAKGKKVSST